MPIALALLFDLDGLDGLDGMIPDAVAVLRGLLIGFALTIALTVILRRRFG